MNLFHQIQVIVLLLCFNLSKCLAVDYRFFVAGGGAAAFSHGITTPVDVVKTKMQANPKEFEGESLVEASLKIIKNEGTGALLGGLVPTVVGYGLEGAAKFGCYEVLKPVFGNFISDQATAFIFASVVAGAIAALMLCPAESARIKIVTDKSYADESFLSALSRIVKEDGVGSIFAGFPAMLSKQVPYTTAKQCSFDLFASLLYVILKDIDMKVLIPILGAAGASILACIFSQPGDMILTETYRGNEQAFGKVVSKLWGAGGVGQFFVGTNARLVHVGAIITSQLVVYDMLKQLLGLPATGTH